MSATHFEPPTRPIGVIEALAEGFETVAERLPLVLLPLLLDLMIWAGPRLSARPAVETFYQNIIVPSMEQQSDEAQELFGLSSDEFGDLIAELPPQYLPVVNWPMGDVLFIGVPTLVARQLVAPLPFNFRPPLWEMRSILGVLSLSLLLPLGWSVLGVFYRGLVAQQVSEGQVRLFDLLKRWPVYWLNLAGLMLAFTLLALAVMVPFFVVAAVLSMFGPAVGSLAVTAGIFVIMWLGIFASFTTHSVLLNEKWALSALWDSMRVVQWNLSSTTMLWLLVVGMNMGLSFLFEWAGLTMDTWFVLLAIGVHAFVNTALIAATFVYFKDRYRHWYEMRTLLSERLDHQIAEQAKQLLEHQENDARKER
jgi:hypothetical protein